MYFSPPKQEASLSFLRVTFKCFSLLITCFCAKQIGADFSIFFFPSHTTWRSSRSVISLYRCVFLRNIQSSLWTLELEWCNSRQLPLVVVFPTEYYSSWLPLDFQISLFQNYLQSQKFWLLYTLRNLAAFLMITKYSMLCRILYKKWYLCCGTSGD